MFSSDLILYFLSLVGLGAVFPLITRCTVEFHPIGKNPTVAYFCWIFHPAIKPFAKLSHFFQEGGFLFKFLLGMNLGKIKSLLKTKFFVVVIIV